MHHRHVAGPAITTLVILLGACSSEPGADPVSAGNGAWMPPGSEDRWQQTLAAVRAGFPDVDHVDVPTLAARPRGSDDPLLIDVRPEPEWRVSHLPDSRHAPQDTLVDDLADLPRDTPLVVYCSVGWRSAAAARTLEAAGFTNVRNLIGSAFEWANRGLPLVDGDGAPTDDVHPYDEDWAHLVAPEHRAPLH